MLDAYGVGGTERERVDAPQRPLGQAYQFWGHWAHTRRDAQGRVSDRSPEVILGQATGRAIDPVRRRRALRRRQLRRTVRQYGQLRLHNCGLSGEPGWWGQRVAVWVDDDRLRIEQAEPMVVSYPCVDDPRQRRITESDA
jgi:hypothetical protein